jgi:hypothetical protein
MNKCSQRRITRGFSLIIDDYGHRKRGNFRDGVVVTTHTSIMMAVKAYHYI